MKTKSLKPPLSICPLFALKEKTRFHDGTQS